VKTYIILALFFLFGSFAQAVIPNAHLLSEQILRGGRPEMSDLEELKAQGYKTIINLENDELVVAEEKAYAESLGFKYISNPMNPTKRPVDQEIDRLLFEMQNSENYPIFLHCQHGRDRTGLLSGLYRVFADKWQPDVAYQEMIDFGFRPIFSSMKKYFFDKTKGP
jgi:tyrosine-protein phosphatase SIW14